MNRTFSGRAMHDAEQIPADQERFAGVVYDAMRKVNTAEETIAREVKRVKDRADRIADDVAKGMRVSYPELGASDLEKAVKDRQDAFDLLVSLIGNDNLERYLKASKEAA